MKELNELVEQAKFVADWYGSDWSSALCKDKDGKQAHEIICESRGESVISTGSNSNEASWLCDYLELCSPANILAIAEAFRALEQESQKNPDGALAWQQRAEAAEAKLDTAVRATDNLDAERNALRAELAELEKQEPVDFRWRWARDENAVWTYCHMDKFDAAVSAFGDNAIYEKVYARPAPAVSLAELVPEEVTASDAECSLTMSEAESWAAGVNWVIGTIRRNIEEQSQ